MPGARRAAGRDEQQRAHHARRQDHAGLPHHARHQARQVFQARARGKCRGPCRAFAWRRRNTMQHDDGFALALVLVPV